MKNSSCRHPLPIRVWHWLHAFLILALVVTGIPLWNPGIHILSYGSASVSHKYLGFLLAGSFVFWLAYCLASGRFAGDYVPTAGDLRNLPKQAVLYLFSSPKKDGAFPGSYNSRFSPIQKTVYFCIMTILMPVCILTGIMMSDSGGVLLAILTVNGIERLYTVHRVSGYILFLFLIVHVYAATLHRPWWSRYRAMITGFEEENRPDSSKR